MVRLTALWARPLPSYLLTMLSFMFAKTRLLEWRGGCQVINNYYLLQSFLAPACFSGGLIISKQGPLKSYPRPNRPAEGTSSLLAESGPFPIVKCFSSPHVPSMSPSSGPVVQTILPVKRSPLWGGGPSEGARSAAHITRLAGTEGNIRAERDRLQQWRGRPSLLSPRPWAEGMQRPHTKPPAPWPHCQ